jgi:hypothetical protein
VSPSHLLPPEKVEPQKLLEDQKRRVEVGVEAEEAHLDCFVDETSTARERPSTQELQICGSCLSTLRTYAKPRCLDKLCWLGRHACSELAYLRRDGSALMMFRCAVAHTVGACLSRGKATARPCTNAVVLLLQGGWGASSVSGVWMIQCRRALRVVDWMVMATQRPRQATTYNPLPVGSHALHGPHNLTGSVMLTPSTTMVQ